MTRTRQAKSAVNNLETYLGRFRRRYKMRIITTAIAAILFSILLVSIITLLLKNTLADSNWLYFPARAMLFILPVIITIALLYRPYRDFKRSEGVDELESAVPEFNGRVDTYLDMKRRDSNSPFVDLLARDASKTAARAPVKKILPGSEVMGPVVASFGMLALAAWLFTAMPLDWRASVKQLWMGWFINDILPERSIAIAPGDTKIRLGDSLKVTATIEGFESNIAQLHVQRIDTDNQTGSSDTPNSASDWEVVNMNQSAKGTFDFTLYGLSEPINYYVSSAFTESERASVDVVIPPKVTSISHQYNYPEWTALEPKLIDDASEISAIAGTAIDVTFVTDKPLQQATISHDENSIAAELTGDNTYVATVVVEVPGEYQLLEVLDDSKIPLSKAFDINIVEDAQPTIAFTQPGGDWSATSIEEVTVKVEAQDDYKVASVTMNYSVNGGDWQQVELSDDNSFEHLFMLEEFTSENDQPLIAGDLISYYAEAKDREQQASTDIMFIDVRPFDRRYTQSQQAGGGGGGGQQQQGQEISQRQKEILVSTFNLIRDSKQKNNQPKFQPIDPADTAVLLSELQTTLADQAIKLAERAEARQLLNNDPDIARFVEYMEEASSSMRPSSDALENMNLEEAVTHQQRALQFLKRAESIFNDISVTQNQGGGGGGSSPGRDMAEIYELEMDLAKNQYERPDRGPQADQQQQSADDAFDKLKELAKRQERLAQAAERNEKLTEAERWQQEKLKRELEELKAELERLQRQSAEQQQGGEQGGEQQSGGDQSTQQAMQNLQEAIDALEEAQNAEQAQGENQQANANESSQSEEQQRAAREAMQAASARLRESVEQAEEAQQEQLQQQIADAADAVRELNDKQEDTSKQLYEALQRAMEARRQGRFESGLDEQQQDQLAEAKRQMQRDLESIMRDLEDTTSRFEEQFPQTAEQLERALENLDANDISERIGISGDMIDEGQAPQAAMREEDITNALQNLQTDLADASGIGSSENQNDQQVASADDAARAVQQLRQALSEALSEASGEASSDGQQAQREQLERGQGGDQNSDQDAAGQQGSEGEQGQGEQGQQGQGQQGQGQEGQSGEGEQGQGQDGQGQGQGQGDGQNSTPNNWGQGNGSNDGDIRINDGQVQLIEESIVQLQELTSGDIDDLSEQTRQALSDLTRELSNEDEVDRRIEANVRLLLRQLEQLELSIYNDSKPDTTTRSQTRIDDPKGYDRLTEEYFRRLSEPSGS